MLYDIKLINTIGKLQNKITNINQINKFLDNIRDMNEEHKIIIAIILLIGFTTNK